MSLLLPKSVFVGRQEFHSRTNCRVSRILASLDTRTRPPRTTVASPVEHCFDETRERIAKLLQKPQLSISTYDTAWVAMVPSPHSKDPFFPECLNWLLENQCPDGSWALPHHHDLLRKDVLSSTLACVLALKKWAVGEEQMERGAHFIESNFASVFEDSQASPIGFDVIFPKMLEYAGDFSLILDLEPTALSALFSKRDSELKRYQNQPVEMEASMAFLAEGMGKSLDWSRLMKYQRENDSFFNSPSTTAAAYIGSPNASALNYLQSVVKKFGDAVPASYPLDIYLKLSTVDSLERLGIRQYFNNEIQDVLDEAYRCWVQGSEEIFMDASTCALAFRLLRMHEYSVTSDHVVKAIRDWFSSFFRENLRDMHAALELYKASELILYPHELELENQNSRLKHLLEQEISSSPIHSIQLCRNIDQEVSNAIMYPFYAILDGITKKMNIEHFNLNNTRILKTSYCSPNFAVKDFLFLSLQDFNKCQEMHRSELKELERWVIDNKLDDLKFARQKCAYCYFSAAASIFSPEQSDSRMSWAKNGVLTTIVDDFFDIGGSMDELKDLIQLVEIWDVDVDTQCCSESVKTIFSALKQTICDIGDKAYMKQGRCVTDHVIQTWLDLLHSMMKEAEWARDKSSPTMDEYMTNAYTSFALGPIVLPAVYLIGPKLSEEMVQHPEYENLFRLMSTCGRLLNDIRSCEREMKDGKLNAVALYSGDEMNKEAAIESMKRWIERQRRELLRIVMEKSVIPKPCKDVFMHMLKVVHLFYSKDDGFTSDDMIKVVKQIIYEPAVVP